MSANSQNRALSGSIISSFFYYVVFSTIGLIAITTANLVDGAFVGNYVGADALAVISLLVPYFTFLIALALMLAIGGSVTAGKYIGAGKVKQASITFSQSLVAILVITLSLAVLSFAFEDSLYRLLNVPEYLRPMCTQYFGIIRWVLVIQLFTMVLYYFVRADGHPKLATGALVSGAVMNILLDILLVVYLQKGLRGAAYATAMAQVIQLAILSQYFLRESRTLTFQMNFYKAHWKYLWQSAYNGVSEFINEVSVAMIFLLLNSLLIAGLGVNGVAAFSITNYFIFLSIMLCYGVADSLHLVASQNLGAGNTQRIEKFLAAALSSALTIGLIIVAIVLQWKRELISWFLNSKDEHVASLSAEILMIVWPLFLVNGINIIFSCYLTAMHQPRPAAAISMARGLILPVSLLVTFYFLLEKITLFKPWVSQTTFLIALPLSEIITLAIAVYLYFQYTPDLILDKNKELIST